MERFEMARQGLVVNNTAGPFCFYADAQATIAALQARVQELEEWKHIVTGAGTDQESVIRLAAYEYTKIAVQCWKEANAKLESQLTQRTAELEAAKRERGNYRTVLEGAEYQQIDEIGTQSKDLCLVLGKIAKQRYIDLHAELERVKGADQSLAEGGGGDC